MENKKIQEMIALQKEDALKDFETIDFQRRLQRRLALEPKKKPRPLRNYMLAAAAAVLVIITSIYIGTSYFSPGLERRDLINMFARLPVFRQTIPDASIMETKLTEEEILRLELQWKVDERFYSSYSKTLDTEVLAARLQRLFDAEKMQGDESDTTRSILSNTTMDTSQGTPGDPFNLEKRLQKLKKQNKVQLFFDKFKKNKKEA